MLLDVIIDADAGDDVLPVEMLIGLGCDCDGFADLFCQLHIVLKQFRDLFI